MKLFIKPLIVGVAIAVSSHSVFASLLDAGAVAAPDEYGAKVAAQVLKEGGNAVDAAVATAFTLAVTYPEAGNIGGGGFMTLYVKGKPYFLDYREVAPKAATKDMYLNEKGEVTENLSVIGAKASGVPGTVMGLWEAHKRFGKLPWRDLVTPAIGYARNGFTVAEKQYQYRSNVNELFKGKTNFGEYFGAMKAGTNFKQPELAKTLERIAENGPDDFYKGFTAKLLVAQMKKDDGLITAADLESYQAKWREPMRVDWQGKTLYTAPLPSSGGISLAQLIGIKEQRAADFKGVELNSAKYIHLLAEIEKRVFADRANYMGDPDFAKVPVDKLIDPAYIKQRASEVNPDAISATESVRPGLESHQTTHFSIVDADGNAVSNTYTLNFDYGNGVVVAGAGFLLNDEMDDFSAKPGAANGFGVLGTDANAIEPGKRMLSSMSPTIVTRDGQVDLVVGTPGGSRIFTSIFQVLNDVYDFNMPIAKAVAAQRVHHQLLPKDTIYFDSYAPLTGKVADELKTMGYTIEDQGWLLGDIQAIKVNGKSVETASDPRGRGTGIVVK
ncbi:gamma-glutamyltransferase [Pseudomonas sp. R5(2019)]|uniref:gamma-glutamyltransferase n=1 Tax=Pseudomonas sp. R5(2019) TaxID=2697566 RepID=UPI001412C1F9|nr:gamma-glutamyltransferase [Pseudomonas sp. R5(2019)]NBA93570.1 gamma-glutamyltransferase [Pseudomonas sp. R5(2019)]